MSGDLIQTFIIHTFSPHDVVVVNSFKRNAFDGETVGTSKFCAVPVKFFYNLLG